MAVFGVPPSLSFSLSGKAEMKSRSRREINKKGPSDMMIRRRRRAAHDRPLARQPTDAVKNEDGGSR